MKIQKLTALLAAIILLTAATAQEGKKEAKKELSNTRIASCLVKITCDPAVLPLNFGTIERLLHSSGVGGKAAREILEIPMLTDETEDLVDFGIEPLSEEPQHKRKRVEFDEDEEYMREMRALSPIAEPMTMRSDPRPRVEGILGNTAFISGLWRKVGDNIGSAKVLEIKPTYVKVEWQGRQKTLFPVGVGTTYASEQPLFFRLGVELDKGVKPAAEEFMKALVDNLRKTLNAAFNDYSDRFGQQLDLAARDVQNAEADLVGLQEKLRQILGTYNLERQAILDDISRSRDVISATEMELETNEAFVNATSKRIAETEKKMMNKLGNDPVLSELQKIIAMHEERVKKHMRKGTPEELSQARENLARARIELAERREQISQSAGAELIDSLRNEISELTVQGAQALKRIDHLKRQLSKAEHLLEKADNYELVSLRVKIAKQTLEESLLLHSRMKRRGLLISPSVVVFGAD